MLYIFHGTDIHKSAEKARALAASLRTKRPDAAFVEMDEQAWSMGAIAEHLGGQGLFSSKYIVFLNRVTENADAKDTLPSLLASMNESPNIFLVLESKLNAELKRAVEKSAEKAVVSDLTEAAPKKEFNIFGLADAFARGDAFKAWNGYREALEGGAEPEAIIGMLFWKAKAINNPAMARELLVLYHEGHRGRVDLELALERFALGAARNR